MLGSFSAVSQANRTIVTKKKARKWITGPWRDWCIPFRCNMWFQFSAALLFLSLLSIPVFLMASCSQLLVFSGLSALLSMIVLGMTEFGRGTVRAYRRARHVILHTGRFNKRMQAQYEKRLYCFRAGARAAAFEYGLSNDLLPGLANKWRPW